MTRSETEAPGLGNPLKEWEPHSIRCDDQGGNTFRAQVTKAMKKTRRNRQHAKIARLRRHVEIALDLFRPRRIRTRSARYAAALGEQLGLITRPRCCSWCRRHLRLERHHWDYGEPLNVTYLCADCHDIADSMVARAEIA